MISNRCLSTYYKTPKLGGIVVALMDGKGLRRFARRSKTQYSKTMKHLLLLSAAAILSFLPSCTTYVNDGGYAASRPVHRTSYGYRPAPAPYRAYPATYTQTRLYNSRASRYDHRRHDDDRDYRRVNTPKRHWNNSNANVRVQTNTVRLNTNAGLRL